MQGVMHVHMDTEARDHRQGLGKIDDGVIGTGAILVGCAGKDS
jgi:hypothetical protein